ncbi:hypothetical protein [Candidatus Uabimicrobium amorphum]|uniref:Alpha-2-macroglobulin domain-containing protein n=1 Tax=Uabimicrobium amorphum TaxID=2596890 RepID=A0A5S9IQZ0_UABAM|nr:hypothetical protein [Candidatus Uabimicrobium amorphum]BBM85841.1 hypothetical protein UABAM_04219 [Candidatus Uabimicrobium amorphum]
MRFIKFCIFMWCCYGLLSAQVSLRTTKTTFLVGEKMTVHVVTPDISEFPSAKVMIYDVHRNQKISDVGVKKGKQVLTITAPNLVGKYFLLLVANKMLLRKVMFRTVVTSVKALSIGKRTYVVGEKLYVKVNLPQGRYYGNPWVGMFHKGQRLSSGVSIAEERIHYQYTKRKKMLEFHAPADPGTYQLKIYDRTERYYLLDSVTFKTIVPPVRGALQIAKNKYTIGEKISVKVNLPQGRYYGRAWVGMFNTKKTVDGGAEADTHQRITYHYTKREQTLTFDAPSHPGKYIFRIYDRDSYRYLLDSVAFETEVPPVRGALQIAKKTYTIGEKISVKVNLPEGRYYGRAWVGMFNTKKTVDGGAEADTHQRITYHYTKRQQTVTFDAPAYPGKYIFRVYDRDSYRYLLDSVAFETEVPPVRGALQIAKKTYTIGEKISVKVNLPEGRYYGRAWVGMFNTKKTVDGGAGADTHQRISYHYTKSQQTLTFDAPAYPGKYIFRVYDRDSYHYLLDSVAFETKVPPVRGALQVAKKKYIIGEKISVKVNLPGGRYYGRAWVGMFNTKKAVEGGAEADTHQRINYHYTKRQQTVTFNAPAHPGKYIFRVYDRDSYHYLLDSVAFETVVPATRGAITVNPRSYMAGKKMIVNINLPKNRYYGDPWVGMFRSSSRVQGGGKISERRITSSHIRNKKQLEFTAPQQPGIYEMRLYDRHSHYYVLEVVYFRVYHRRTRAPFLQNFRETPFPRFIPFGISNVTKTLRVPFGFRMTQDPQQILNIEEAIEKIVNDPRFASLAPRKQSQLRDLLYYLKERRDFIEDPELPTLLDTIAKATDNALRDQGLRRLANKIYQRAAHFTQMAANGELDVDDARYLANMTKYGKTLYDDFKNLQSQDFLGDSDGVTQFLTVTHGVTALAKGAKDRDAEVMMDGLRDTIGQIPGISNSPIAAILDIPGEVTASMLNVTREGWEESTSVLENISRAMDGDERALDEAVRGSQRVQEVLSQKNYGRRMFRAITNRVIDKVPFARTIVTWFSE